MADMFKKEADLFKKMADMFKKMADAFKIVADKNCLKMADNIKTEYLDLLRMNISECSSVKREIFFLMMSTSAGD